MTGACARHLMLRGVARWQRRNPLKSMVPTSTLAASSSANALAPGASRLAADRVAATTPLRSRARRRSVREFRPIRAVMAPVVDEHDLHVWRRASSSLTSCDANGSDLPGRFAEAAGSTDAFRPGDRVLACVSGGSDSVALLTLLVEIRHAWDLDVRAVHFNHGVRVDESAEDAVFVEALCARLDVELHVRAPEKPFALSNFQAKARQWRRDETVVLLEFLGANVALQGHHADDQTETVLLKLIRGCHLSNIAGMRPREGVFGRPLLSFPKRDLVEFLESRAETWREDPSNTSPKYLRNRVRAELIPLLRELVDEGGFESRVEALTVQSAHLRELLDDVPSTHLAHGEAPTTSSSTVFDRSYLARGEIDLDAWSDLSTLVRQDQLHAYVSNSAGVDMEYHVLRKLCARLFARASADANAADAPEWEWRIRGDWVLRSVGTRAWVVRTPRLDLKTKQAVVGNRDEGDADSRGTGKEVVIDAGRGVSIAHPPGWSIRTSWETSSSKGDTTGDNEGVRLSNLPDVCALRLRFRQPGDAFQPEQSPSRGRRVKLKDWMRANGVPLHARDRTPLVCLGGEIVAVYPCASAETQSSEDGSVMDGRRGARLNLVVDCVSVDDVQ